MCFSNVFVREIQIATCFFFKHTERYARVLSSAEGDKNVRETARKAPNVARQYILNIDYHKLPKTLNLVTEIGNLLSQCYYSQCSDDFVSLL